MPERPFSEELADRAEQLGMQEAKATIISDTQRGIKLGEAIAEEQERRGDREDAERTRALVDRYAEHPETTMLGGLTALDVWEQVRQSGLSADRDAEERVDNDWTRLGGRTSATPSPADNPVLFHRLDRLARFQRWLHEDAEFAAMIDTALNDRARGATRRQAIINVTIAIVSLIVGWLLEEPRRGLFVMMWRTRRGSAGACTNSVDAPSAGTRCSWQPSCARGAALLGWAAS
jgi:hypothetical protein